MRDLRTGCRPARTSPRGCRPPSPRGVRRPRSKGRVKREYQVYEADSDADEFQGDAQVQVHPLPPCRRSGFHVQSHQGSRLGVRFGQGTVQDSQGILVGFALLPLPDAQEPCHGSQVSLPHGVDAPCESACPRGAVVVLPHCQGVPLRPPDSVPLCVPPVVVVTGCPHIDVSRAVQPVVPGIPPGSVGAFHAGPEPGLALPTSVAGFELNPMPEHLGLVEVRSQHPPLVLVVLLVGHVGMPWDVAGVAATHDVIRVDSLDLPVLVDGDDADPPHALLVEAHAHGAVSQHAMVEASVIERGLIPPDAALRRLGKEPCDVRVDAPSRAEVGVSLGKSRDILPVRPAPAVLVDECAVVVVRHRFPASPVMPRVFPCLQQHNTTYEVSCRQGGQFRRPGARDSHAANSGRRPLRSGMSRNRAMRRAGSGVRLRPACGCPSPQAPWRRRRQASPGTSRSPPSMRTWRRTRLARRTPTPSRLRRGRGTPSASYVLHRLRAAPTRPTAGKAPSPGTARSMQSGTPTPAARAAASPSSRIFPSPSR